MSARIALINALDDKYTAEIAADATINIYLDNSVVLVSIHNT